MYDWKMKPQKHLPFAKRSMPHHKIQRFEQAIHFKSIKIIFRKMFHKNIVLFAKNLLFRFELKTKYVDIARLNTKKKLLEMKLKF